MLKGKQKKLDKNNNGRIDAEDFKILQGSKKGMRMGGLSGSETSKRQGPSKYATPPKKGKSGYGAARTSGMGLQDESMKPGKVMKARKGRLSEYERGFDVDPLVRSGKMSRATADAMDTGLNAAMGITGAAGAGAVYKALSTAKKEAKRRKTLKKSKKMTASEGSFRVGGLSRQRLDSIAAHRNKQAKMKKEKQKEENIRKTEISPMGARRGVLANAMESQRALQKSRYLSALEKAMKENKDRLTARDIEAAKKMPEKRKGGVMKPKKAMLGLYIADKALKKSDTARKRASLTGIPGMMASNYYGKKYGKSKGGMLKARSGKLAESMKKLREKAYEKSGKKMKGVGRYGKDEYMIQKKLPGMRTGKAVDTLKVIPTVKGKKQIAKDFSPSEKNKKTNKYKDYK